MPGRKKVIGIGGVSCSGKSLLAGELSSWFNESGRNSIILNQDDYVFPTRQIPLINSHVDWERPESIDFRKYEKAIVGAAELHDIVIAEGLMVFWDPAIFSLLDFSIFIELPGEEFTRRKKIDLRWGEEPRWYIDHIWDSYLVYGQFPGDSKPDIRLKGDEAFDVDGIYRKITDKLFQ